MKDMSRTGSTRRELLAALCAGAALPALATSPVRAQAPAPALDVPYVPTPQDVVDRMLDIVKPTDKDFVMDLGCGDGRMLVTAAVKFGARGRGVDLNPVRIAEATESAKRAGVADKIQFEVKNLFETSIRDATVLAMYLLPSVNLQLRPRILGEMKPGSRIVSHAFHMADWAPDLQDEVRGRNIYHWIVPAKVAGKWNLRDGGETVVLDVFQQYQKLSGTVQKDGRAVGKLSGDVKGDIVTFNVETGGPAKTYSGRATSGMIDGGSGHAWLATHETQLSK